MLELAGAPGPGTWRSASAPPGLRGNVLERDPGGAGGAERSVPCSLAGADPYALDVPPGGSAEVLLRQDLRGVPAGERDDPAGSLRQVLTYAVTCSPAP